MALTHAEIQGLAETLYHAKNGRRSIPPLSSQYPDACLEDAYAIQAVNASRAIKEGQRKIGYKLGLTSREAQVQFKVFQPDYGHLFDTMARLPDAEINLDELIQPKIEGEIAFVLGKDLKGPGLSLVDAMRAVEFATLALEIIDSRIEGWKIRAFDTIADNGSSALFVLGGTQNPINALDLTSLGMALSKNGEVMVTGSGAAVLGHPLASVVFLANALGKQDKMLHEGDIVLSGSLGRMLSMNPGDVFTCELWKMGRVSVRVKEGERP